MVDKLFNKYEIRKRDGSPVDPEAEYFVLRLDTDPIARAAAVHYSKLTSNLVLATDLWKAVTRHEQPSDSRLLSCDGFAEGHKKGRWEAYMDMMDEASRRARQVITRDESANIKVAQCDGSADTGVAQAELLAHAGLLRRLAPLAARDYDDVLADTIIPDGPYKGKRYRNLRGEPPYDGSNDNEPRP